MRNLICEGSLVYISTNRTYGDVLSVGDGIAVVRCLNGFWAGPIGLLKVVVYAR